MKQLRELGQNFLIDAQIAAEIASAAAIQPGEAVWEIGPGMGILTRELLSFQPRLTAFELDRRLIPILAERFGDSLTLIHGDILRHDWQELIASSSPSGTTGPLSLKLVSNLPYQITSPLLELLQTHHESFSRIVLMLQREVALRLVARAGSKAYGAMSLRIQLCFDVEVLMQVPRHLFDPVPKVDSTVVRLLPRRNLPLIRKPDVFHRLIRIGFASRRKTLRNNLRALYDKSTLDRVESSSGISLTRRAETISEAEFTLLSDLL